MVIYILQLINSVGLCDYYDFDRCQFRCPSDRCRLAECLPDHNNIIILAITRFIVCVLS